MYKYQPVTNASLEDPTLFVTNIYNFSNNSFSEDPTSKYYFTMEAVDAPSTFIVVPIILPGTWYMHALYTINNSDALDITQLGEDRDDVRDKIENVVWYSTR